VKALFSLSCATALLLSSLSKEATAHPADDPYYEERDRLHAPLRPQDSYRSPQYAAIEVRFGPYRPNVDDEFSGATPFADSYGTGPSVMGGIEVDYQFLRVPYLGTLAAGLGVSYVQYEAAAPFADGSGASEHPMSLWLLPVNLLGVFRVDTFSRDFHVPLVPYIKAGLVYAFWEARDANRTSTTEAGSQGLGAEYGFTVNPGLMLELNFLAPQQAIDMDIASGVNHAYLFGEWMFSSVNSFGSGMEVGASTWVLGLAIEY
jgi:hypothetical protein